MLLPIGPDVLDRIQFRRIVGEVLDPQSLALRVNKIASELAFVGGPAVPDDPQRSGNVTPQRLQKVAIRCFWYGNAAEIMLALRMLALFMMVQNDRTSAQI